MKSFLIRLSAWLILTSVALYFGSCDQKKSSEKKETTDSLAIPYSVRTQWVHDTGAFTQGLVIYNGKLYESTGQKQSWIGIVDINTGVPDKKVVLDDIYFGEGITILNNKVYQLTWESKVGFVYNLKTFKKLRDFQYETPGWGITHDSVNLIMSDGTEHLIYLDTTSLQPIKKLKVTDEKGPVKNLNELEYVEGYVFANIWQTNQIVKIDPATGRVVGRMDLTPLARDAQMRNPKVDVLNGIAYHPTTRLFLVTGKYWPMIYVLKLKD